MNDFIPSLKGIQDSLKSPQYVVQWVLGICFAMYIIFPVPTPQIIQPFVLSTLGMLFAGGITLLLFFLRMPLLAILYILVVYELVRRSQYGVGYGGDVIWNESDSQSAYYTKNFAYGNNTNMVNIATETSSDVNKDDQLRRMNPRPQISLEETIVEQRAPIGRSDPVQFVSTGYEPVASTLGSISSSSF